MAATDTCNLPTKFVRDCLLNLSPLAAQLYLHLLLIAKEQVTPIVSEQAFFSFDFKDIELTNTFFDPQTQRLLEQKIVNLKHELVQANLLISATDTSLEMALIYPETWSKLYDLQAFWQRELKKLPIATRQALTYHDFLPAKGFNFLNQELLAELQSDLAAVFAKWQSLKIADAPLKSSFEKIAVENLKADNLNAENINPEVESAHANSRVQVEAANSSLSSQVGIIDKSLDTQAKLANQELSSPNELLKSELSQELVTINPHLNAETLPAKQSTNFPVKNEKNLSDQVASAAKDKADFDRLVKSIYNSFLVGMQYFNKWSRLLDKMHYTYAMEVECIYSIFRYFKTKKQQLYLGEVEKYVKKLAEAGVKSEADFVAYVENEAKLKERVDFIKQQLGRYIATEAEIACIHKWFDDYHYDEQILKYAFRYSCKTVYPTIAFFDKIISKWHAAGCKNLSEIQAYEKQAGLALETGDKLAPSRSNSKNYQAFFSNQKQRQKDIFMERQYDADFFKRLLAGERGNDLLNNPNGDPAFKEANLKPAQALKQAATAPDLENLANLNEAEALSSEQER